MSWAMSESSSSPLELSVTSSVNGSPGLVSGVESTSVTALPLPSSAPEISAMLLIVPDAFASTVNEISTVVDAPAISDAIGVANDAVPSPLSTHAASVSVKPAGT